MAVNLRKKSHKYSNAWTLAFGLGLSVVGFILALGSYNPNDPSLNTFSSTWKSPTNVLGYLGSWLSDLLYQGFGLSAWLFPLLLFAAILRWSIRGEHKEKILGSRWWAAWALLSMSVCLCLEIFRVTNPLTGFPIQGLLGFALGAVTLPLVGKIGAFLLCLVGVWAFCMVWWESLPSHFVNGVLWTAKTSQNLFALALENWKKQSFAKPVPSTKENTKEPVLNVAPAAPTPEISPIESKEVATTAELNPLQPVIRKNDVEASAEYNISPAKQARVEREVKRPVHWDLPPLSLLEYPKKKIKALSEDQLLQTAKKITHALKSFEIDGEVVEISPGPIITMYEFQPGPGVRIQKIVSTSTDLAMALGVPSVRIVAPIPGKSVAGIEVPNSEKQEIVLRDVFESTLEKAKTMRLPLVIGKDIEGAPIIEDLSRMPHLLIGGATSMGKSVLMNSILTSLLCRYTPDDLKLIIVDPKLVEFKVFEDIPHLLLPIVNDPTDASQALKWAVSETKRRYVLMQKYSAKNLESYNEKISKLPADETDALGNRPARLSYIVIIVDELAELMMTAKKDVEQSIVRLTQLARAAGIHLIMATQRPSADIVTGLIKSNCPTRAALRVASASDSRIILDCSGAEQLLGRGDMFFTSSGPMGLKRMQGAYVSDMEIEKIGDFWRNQGEPEYKDEILAPQTNEDGSDLSSGQDRDMLFKDVLDFAKEKGKVSTSLIQRKFQIGYTRAARIMEQLEDAGIVGPQSSAGQARDVLV